ncbi:MAG TPA: RagB/SusD family nutrient uptake outer membrane protein, partial [Gemmatimonadales bacterium]|nr:RagB/SusD family nutrient uptake outer membrane protein [Gemmatimonadales bacterium]
NVNRTRARAGLAGLVLGTTVPNTQAGVLNAVRDERRKEFAEEGDRFPDLSRDPAYAIPRLNNINPNRLLFPIPQAEIDLAPEVTQNPGY